MSSPEQDAKFAYESLPIHSKQEMGGCLGALPDAEDLDIFLDQAKQAWQQGWLNAPARYPHLLLRLYHCVAFLRYEGNKFWDSFAEVVGDSNVDQTRINDVFDNVAQRLGLTVLHGTNRQCVQSAVRHVGIPVRVWRGFISVCERLWLAGDEWKQWSNDEWESGITMWVGGRKNLRDFFVKNKETATKWIEEIFDARQVLTTNPQWTLSDIKQMSLLRPEYFEADPETALFLRPDDPESLFRDRPRLRFREQDGIVSITLEAPRIAKESDLPATWRVAERCAEASTNPVALALDSEAFVPALTLHMIRGDADKKFPPLRGMAPWALWSDMLGSFVSPEARRLPVGFYTIISRHKLAFAQRDGWLDDDDEECRWNQEYELRDGSNCFLAHLHPEGRRAALEVEGWHQITFAPRERLELRLFPSPANRFQLDVSRDGVVRLPDWPWFLVKMPKGMLANSGEETALLLNREFRLYTADRRINGKWLECGEACGLEDDQLFHFKVADDARYPPPRQQPPRPSVTLGGFNQLNAAMVVATPQDDSLPFSVQLRSERHGVIPFGNTAEVRLGKTKTLQQSHLAKLQVRFRDYLPWFLLTATQDHASWEELLIAYEMMNVSNLHTRLNQWAFIVIEHTGMMKRRGQCWTDFENRIHFGTHEHGTTYHAHQSGTAVVVHREGTFCVRYAGLTNPIYSLLAQVEPTGPIKAVWERGHPPHLEMRFTLQGDTDRRLRRLCEEQQIRIMHESLWTH